MQYAKGHDDLKPLSGQPRDWYPKPLLMSPVDALDTLLLLGLALLATAPAFANQQLAQQKNCMSCHAVDKKIVGPAYKDVAAKYKNDPKAEAMLVQKVMKGGAGVWGPVPMPANNISEADAKTLVKWVMSQK